MEPFSCESCHFRLFIPIATLSVSEVGLYDDDRFPGRCIMPLTTHYEALEDVPEDVAGRFVLDATRVGRALRDLGLGSRINYASLGNTESHVHMHVFPRAFAADPIPSRPPWEHPRAAAPLESTYRMDIVARLRSALTAT